MFTIYSIYSKECDRCGIDFEFKWEGVGVFLSEVCLNRCLCAKTDAVPPLFLSFIKSLI